MFLFKSILGLFGGGLGGGGGFGGGMSNSFTGDFGGLTSGISMPVFGSAKGNVFGSGVNAFANGGTFANKIVSRPTLFRYADGGAISTGLMGEAGPEAILPLSRGADGKLGVSVAGTRSDSFSPYSASQSYLEQRVGSAAVAAKPEPIDVRFETTRIAGVDYVTADEFRAGMKQAAEQGRSLAMSSLQNSVRARKKVGLA